MKVNSNALLDYVSRAPTALAFERTVEARILAAQVIDRPVLDIGCGDGLFAHITFDEPIDTGIDPDARELKRAGVLGSYLELIACSGANIPKADGSYRTIICNSVLEHIPDVLPVLHEAYRVLVPQGRMYVTVPTERFEQYAAGTRLLSRLGLSGMSMRFRKRYNAFWRHYHCLPQDAWCAMMQSIGFVVVESYTYNAPGLCLLNDLLVPLSAPAYLLKHVSNRWTMWPALRRISLSPICSAMKPLLDASERSERGGLLFLSLQKGASVHP